jgi:hypothetical protein
MSVLEKEKPQPEKDEKGFRIITEDFCKKLCYYNGGYDSAKLNVNLYLHFQGFRKIQNLENFTNLQVLYLENNSISKIEGLDKLVNLTCLYLQNNYIKEIENLENNKKLSILNLSNNKIIQIPNISYLEHLENLYISKNYLNNIQNLEGLLSLKSLSLLDIQNNPFSDISSDDLISFLNKLQKLKVLYLKGDITRSISNYRRNLIVKIKNLTYLDDRPIKKEDRIGAIAFFEGGFKAEKEARIKYREENDKVIQIRKREKEMLEINFEERKKRALNSLELEYNKRKNELENEKEEINVLYNQNKENKIGKKLYNYLSSIDYRLYENEEFKKNEEKLIQLTIAKRERTDQNDIFEYEEEWMDNIIIINILKHCFDFQRALIGIHAIFKEKNVKNYLLFNELDLRNRWTFLEFNKYRKNNDDTFYYLKNEEVYNEDILDLISGKKIEDNNDIVKNKNNENKLKINIEEGDIDENNNKDALLIESHNEQKKQDLDELD